MRSCGSGALSASVFVLAVVQSGVLRGDVVTPKDGQPFNGVVVAVDEKTVTVKTDTETRVMDRNAIRKIEFGDVPMTGLRGREYTNADYQLRISMPEGWSFAAQPGADFNARKGSCDFFLRGIPADEAVASDGEIKGAVAGMKATLPGSVFSDAESSRFSGLEVKRVSLKAPTASGVVLFLSRSGHFLMFMVLSQDKAKPAEPCLAEWENRIRSLN